MVLRPALLALTVVGLAFAQPPAAPVAATPAVNIQQQNGNPQADDQGRPFHLVQKGDNLFQLSAAYSMTLQQLVELNGIKNNTITVGQRVYLAPPGAKVDLSNLRPTRSATTTTEPDAVDPDEAQKFVYTAQKASSALAEGGGTLVQPRVQRGTMPRPTPASQRTILTNPEFGAKTPSDPRFLRADLPKEDPTLMSLMDVLTPLPLLAKDEPRGQWNARQEGYAAFWEKQVIRTAGIGTSAKWDGKTLWLSVRPSLAAAPVRVAIPGAYLPEEIDLAQLRRWTTAGAVFQFIGHPMYLDGSEPTKSIISGRLLSPWGIVARLVRVSVPAGPSLILTR